MATISYTHLHYTNLPLRIRLRVALAILLTPITFVFLGRSMTVTWEVPDSDSRVVS